MKPKQPTNNKQDEKECHYVEKKEAKLEVKLDSDQSSFGCVINWNINPLPKRNKNTILSEQNCKCASCGTELKSNFLTRANYYFCAYTGSMHCTKCHKKDTAVIPSHVLNNLDFKPSQVCIAAKKYLNNMMSVPCIKVNMFGNEAQTHTKIIQLSKILFELKHIKQYLDNCNQCDIYNEYKNDWIFYDGSLTLKDCIGILSTNNTLDAFQLISNKLQIHIINNCNDCKLKGNYCKICNDKNEMIYSFQYDKTIQCKECNICYHNKCWNGQCVVCVEKKIIIFHSE